MDNEIKIPHHAYVDAAMSDINRGASPYSTFGSLQGLMQLHPNPEISPDIMTQAWLESYIEFMERRNGWLQVLILGRDEGVSQRLERAKIHLKRLTNG